MTSLRRRPFEIRAMNRPINGAYTQITGEFNVINFLNTHGTEATIIQVMHQLPFSSLIVVLFLISAFLFLHKRER
jgi:choline-glycine betaine transporter